LSDVGGTQDSELEDILNDEDYLDDLAWRIRDDLVSRYDSLEEMLSLSKDDEKIDVEKKERTVSSIDIVITNTGDDSDACTEAFAAHLESILNDEYEDVSVSFSSNPGNVGIKIEFDEIDENEEDEYKREYETIDRVKEDIDNTMGYELERFQYA
jgi:hypothetical protein